MANGECLVISFTVNKEIRKWCDRSKDLFSELDIGFKLQCALYGYFLFGANSLSDFSRLCPWSYSVSSLSRAVAKFNPNRTMRRMRSSILKKYGHMNPDDFCYAIDDTSNPRYGKTIFRSGRFGGSGGVYNGQKVLVIVLVNIKEGFALPLTYSFIASKKSDPENYRPGHEVAIDLFCDILDSGYPPLPVTADSWFDSHEFMLNLQSIGLNYCGEIKSNRKVMGMSCRIWKTLKSFFKKKVRKKTKNKKFYSEEILEIRNFTHPIKCIAVFNGRSDKKAFAYYVSTDSTMAGATLWKLSRARWKIECLFRDMKQNLSFGQLPCSGPGGSDLSVCLPMILITSLRLNSETCKQGHLSTIGAQVKMIREASLSKGIEFIASRPTDELVVKFANRRSSINRKPTDRSAEAA
jgi:hypothetical protein